MTNRYEIETDNRTTWVHLGGQTIGRICPLSAEIMGKDARENVTFVGPPTDTFDRFKKLILERYTITLPEEACPTHMTMRRDPMRKVKSGTV